MNSDRQPAKWRENQLNKDRRVNEWWEGFRREPPSYEPKKLVKDSDFFGVREYINTRRALMSLEEAKKKAAGLIHFDDLDTLVADIGVFMLDDCEENECNILGIVKATMFIPEDVDIKAPAGLHITLEVISVNGVAPWPHFYITYKGELAKDFDSCDDWTLGQLAIHEGMTKGSLIIAHGTLIENVLHAATLCVYLRPGE